MVGFAGLEEGGCESEGGGEGEGETVVGGRYAPWFGCGTLYRASSISAGLRSTPSVMSASVLVRKSCACSWGSAPWGAAKDGEAAAEDGAAPEDEQEDEEAAGGAGKRAEWIGKYFPFPQPRSAPILPAGRVDKKREMRGQGWGDAEM